MEWIIPMEPISRSDVVEGDGWIHQVKWDGIRGMCYIENGNLRIFTKKGRERTLFYPELHDLMKLLKAKDAVLDGEIISLDPESKPSFQLMQVRERVNDTSKIMHYAKKYPVRYIVFDILSMDGKPYVNMPLSERRAILDKTFLQGERIALTDSFTDGNALLALMKEKGWEGIVSKKLSSPYIGGKHHREWFKTKLSKKLLAVVCGLSMKDNEPNSLVLGINRGNGLAYIGKASVGLTQEHFRLLKESIPHLKTHETILKTQTSELKSVIWLKPLLTLWVSFLEWTHDGSLRHPKILGFSNISPTEANGQEFTE